MRLFNNLSGLNGLFTGHNTNDSDSPAPTITQLQLNTTTGVLVGVESLIEHEQEKDLPAGTPSTESLVESSPVMASPTVSREAASMTKLYNAVGLEFGGELPKPIPAIFVGDDGKTITAHLNGVCYTTVAPLIHLLIAADKDLTFNIEINSPMLRMEDMISLISAIDMSKASIVTYLTSAQDPIMFLLGISGTKFELLPSVHVFAPLTSFAYGNSDEMVQGSDAFTKYSDMVLAALVRMKVLTTAEVDKLKASSTIFWLSSEEIKSRMGIGE